MFCVLSVFRSFSEYGDTGVLASDSKKQEYLALEEAHWALLRLAVQCSTVLQHWVDSSEYGKRSFVFVSLKSHCMLAAVQAAAGCVKQNEAFCPFFFRSVQGK